MKKYFISLLILLLVFQSNAQFDSLRPFAQLSYTKVVLDQGPWVTNLPSTFGRYNYTAIDVDELQPDTKSKPLPYRLPLVLELGIANQTEKDNLLSLGLSYSNFYRCDSTVNRLRFSDQIDPSNGFTMAGEYYANVGLNYLHFRYNSVGLNLNYLMNDKIGKADYRIGFGLGINRILSSFYFLNLTNTKNGENKDYSHQDLVFKDKKWLISPTVNAQVKVRNVKSGDYWLTSSAHFDINARDRNLSQNPVGSFFTLGLRWEPIKF
jgi:hypothetical protein